MIPKQIAVLRVQPIPSPRSSSRINKYDVNPVSVACTTINPDRLFFVSLVSPAPPSLSIPIPEPPYQNGGRCVSRSTATDTHQRSSSLDNRFHLPRIRPGGSVRLDDENAEGGLSGTGEKARKLAPLGGGGGTAALVYTAGCRLRRRVNSMNRAEAMISVHQ